MAHIQLYKTTVMDNVFDLDRNLSVLWKTGEDIDVVSNVFLCSRDDGLPWGLFRSCNASRRKGGAKRTASSQIGLPCAPGALSAAKDVARRGVRSVVERGRIIELRDFLAEEKAVQLSTLV